MVIDCGVRRTRKGRARGLVCLEIVRHENGRMSLKRHGLYQKGKREATRPFGQPMSDPVVLDAGGIGEISRLFYASSSGNTGFEWKHRIWGEPTPHSGYRLPDGPVGASL